MTVIVVALAVALLATAYVWPLVPLVIYPMRRWRGFWAALYSAAIGAVCAVVFRDLRYMVGDFFELSVVLALLRATVEAAGLAEPARRKHREAREDAPG
ncbi:hypothetical protein SAMN06272735_5153 [Streptomyces sp. TLI_55]|uniref:hypothetical protein n=1 Tax=Streptomyces sp. TLI_55 TaxID=1938861 RepID=UPI000BCB94A2|nr:hypothetical protein [Streptomyces sp. TLI_55]SNX63345.1 hypothetical protein SAMN06272735_5153 [Streptomyces sp. TLI_55]